MSHLRVMSPTCGGCDHLQALHIGGADGGEGEQVGLGELAARRGGGRGEGEQVGLGELAARSGEGGERRKGRGGEERGGEGRGGVRSVGEAARARARAEEGCLRSLPLSLAICNKIMHAPMHMIHSFHPQTSPPTPPNGL